MHLYSILRLLNNLYGKLKPILVTLCNVLQVVSIACVSTFIQSLLTTITFLEAIRTILPILCN